MNTMTSSRYMNSGVRAVISTSNEDPIDDADYAKEFPILADHDPSTCSKCRREYNNDELLALKIPQGEAGTIYFKSSNTEFAVRLCRCGNRIGRRVG